MPIRRGTRSSANFLRNNAEHDCHDDSPDDGPGPDLVPPAADGVANFWIKNNGLTSFPAGLCKGDDDGEEEDDDDHDEDGEHNHDDEDDDNDGHHDNDDEDDDNDGHHDGEDEDDDNDHIHDNVDSKDRETQRTSAGTVGGGQFVDQTIAIAAGTLSLSGLVESPNADRLRVEIFNPLGILVGVTPPAVGQALIKVPITLPGIYLVRVRNTGATPVDYVARVVRSAPW